MVIKKVLVTGFDGYIGSVLVKKLLKYKYNVVGLDTFYFQNNEFESISSAMSIINKDIRLVEENDLKGIDVIIHLAALSNDPLGELNPNLTKEINYKATIRLAKKAKKVGVKKFIFSSSCSVYGISKNGIVNENSPLNPITSYAKTKILAEKKLMGLADKDFFVCILRNATVYGFSSNFRNDLVVNNLTTSALVFNQIRVMSDGTPWRPLIDVRDLCDIFMAFLEIKDPFVNGKVFNIGFNKNNFQIKQLLQIIKTYLPDCKIAYTGEHGADTRSYKVNFDKLHKTFPKIKQKWPLGKSVKDLIYRMRVKQFAQDDFYSEKYNRMLNIKKLLENKSINAKLFWKSPQ